LEENNSIFFNNFSIGILDSFFVLWMLTDTSIYLILQSYLLVLSSKCPSFLAPGFVCADNGPGQSLQFHGFQILEVDATKGEPEKTNTN
jgi:hypothetical protein